MNPDKDFTTLDIIKAEYAEYGHKTKRSVQVAVENRIKRRVRNRVILEGLKIYEKRHPQLIFESIQLEDAKHK